MIRRGLLLAPWAVAAQEGLPARLDNLALHGVAARRYLGFRVYEAALYLSQPAATPEQVADPAAILVRYQRRVALADVRRAWLPSLGDQLEPGFDAWLRDIAPGDEEIYTFTAQGARLDGPGRPPLQLPPGRFTTRLRGAWLGPEAPPALRAGWFPPA